MITPINGHVYIVHHSSGNAAMRFEHVSVYTRPRLITRYIFTNLKTGREVVLKSRVKILREVLNLKVASND